MGSLSLEVKRHLAQAVILLAWEISGSILLHDLAGAADSVPGLYSRGAGFIFRSAYWLSSVMFSQFYLLPSGKISGRCLD